jgi:hypothetical protein
LKRTYQINKASAAQNFGRLAKASTDQIQFALPLPEVLASVQQGLMQLALTAFTQIAEKMMQWEVGELAGPKHQAKAQRERSRWGTQTG